MRLLSHIIMHILIKINERTNELTNYSELTNGYVSLILCMTTVVLKKRARMQITLFCLKS